VFSDVRFAKVVGSEPPNSAVRCVACHGKGKMRLTWYGIVADHVEILQTTKHAEFTRDRDRDTRESELPRMQSCGS
jgi:hypothetical protein